MSLPKHYNPQLTEPQLQAFWQEQHIYEYDESSEKPCFSIDTPPPTVSGYLHLGHCYSYTHTDIIARFWRMKGYNVFYPMGYDDNGLPTERLVEHQLGVTATQIGREAFIEKCLEVSEEAEKEYEALWKRLGLSVDWRYTYRTIGELARYTSQWSFIDLYHQGLVYRRQSPTIWCPECQTAIAQAELDSLERETNFYTLSFTLEDGSIFPIATTRPELLPACVAVLAHPEDSRFTDIIGKKAFVPLFGQEVPIIGDKGTDQEKGTGAVMCCTFGDTDDVYWWNQHQLPLIETITRDGKLNEMAGDFVGLNIVEARKQIVAKLTENGLVLNENTTKQFVRIHERCDTPVEYIVTPQWFVKTLDFKERLLEAGEQIDWYPPQMKNRYREWVENLSWDWCISRQRYFGVTFPVWYCNECNEIILAGEDELPIDPTTKSPVKACRCGNTSFTPETDVMDTWATSSLTPQIIGGFLTTPTLYERLFPMALRPQSHEIIRTWAFYTILKSLYHFDKLPWKSIAISGWGLAPEGAGKISKSRGGGPIAPLNLIQEYSADAVRYWAASTGLGKDSVINIEKVQIGAKLVNKLWNVARFSERFLTEYHVPHTLPILSIADQWILSSTQNLIRRITQLFEQNDYAAAKSEIESFFWRELADNYLEMAKQRLYNEENPSREGALYTLHRVLLTTVKLLAPILPYVTDQIYQGLFATQEGIISVHRATWPCLDDDLVNETANAFGDILIEIATTVRRYKSDHQLPLTTELRELHLITGTSELAQQLEGAREDLMSITRTQHIDIDTIHDQSGLRITIEL